MLEGFDGDTPRLRPPASPATVKQLVTHTAGLSYWFWNADIMRWEAVTGTPNVLSGVNSIFTAPLVADPGTKFEHGINADWLGKVIEAASGVMLDVAVKEGVTGPLGMDETTFLRSSNQAANTTPLHIKGADGIWAPSEMNLVEDAEYWSGGHGLYSTPRDYIKFQRALLGGGELDGVRVLTQVHCRGRFHQPDRRPGLPSGDPYHRPGVGLHIRGRLGIQVGLRAVAQHHRHPGNAPGVQRRLGRAVQQPLLGWTRLLGSAVRSAATSPPFGPPEAIELYANFERAVYASGSGSVADILSQESLSPVHRGTASVEASMSRGEDLRVGMLKRVGTRGRVQGAAAVLIRGTCSQCSTSQRWGRGRRLRSICVPLALSR